MKTISIRDIKTALYESIKNSYDEDRRKLENIVGSVIKSDGVEINYRFDEDAALIHGDGTIKMIVNITSEEAGLAEESAYDVIDKVDEIEEEFHKFYHVDFIHRPDHDTDQTVEIYLFSNN